VVVRSSDSSGSIPEAVVTDEEALRFEQIAAALVEKLKDLPDTEDEPLGEDEPLAFAHTNRS
jgi:hypothetical protein